MTAVASTHSSELRKAIIENNVPVIEKYLDQGGDPNTLLDYGESEKSVHILTESLVTGRDRISYLLIKKGADTESVADFLPSAIEIAAHKGLVETVRLMLRRRVEYENVRDALMVASVDGMLPIVRNIVKKKRIKPIDLEKAFLQAASRGHEDIAMFLLDVGVDPKANGVLHAAVGASNAGLVAEILKRGAPIDAVFGADTVMEMMAVRLKKGRLVSPGVLHALIEYGLDPCVLEDEYQEFSKRGQAQARMEAQMCDWPQ